MALRLCNIKKSYGEAPNVIDGLNLVVENGERLVVTGRNGEGKSTLLRIIAGEDADFSGEMIPGAGVTVGYFSQDSAERISGTESVLEYVEARAPLELIPKIREMLGAFLFRGDDVFKMLDVLSGGEKSRIALLSLLLTARNVLVLDEPTNHLDMHSKDILLDALKDFGGTVIFVSHDRGFIESLATRVLELKDRKSREFPGGYAYYIERLEAERNGSAPAEGGQNGTRRDADDGKRASKLLWEENKRAQAERRKAEKEIKALEDEITALEAQKSELEARLADPAVYSDGQKARQTQQNIDALVSRLEAVTAEWERAMEADG